MKPDHVLAAMLIENNQRADLDPIEEARGLMRLKTASAAATPTSPR
jgi:ParB family chromosome partitioning protein